MQGQDHCPRGKTKRAAQLGDLSQSGNKVRTVADWEGGGGSIGHPPPSQAGTTSHTVQQPGTTQPGSSHLTPGVTADNTAAQQQAYLQQTAAATGTASTAQPPPPQAGSLPHRHPLPTATAGGNRQLQPHASHSQQAARQTRPPHTATATATAASAHPGGTAQPDPAGEILCGTLQPRDRPLARGGGRPAPGPAPTSTDHSSRPGVSLRLPMVRCTGEPRSAIPRRSRLLALEGTTTPRPNRPCRPPTAKWRNNTEPQLPHLGGSNRTTTSPPPAGKCVWNKQPPATSGSGGSDPSRAAQEQKAPAPASSGVQHCTNGGHPFHSAGPAAQTAPHGARPPATTPYLWSLGRLTRHSNTLGLDPPTVGHHGGEPQHPEHPAPWQPADPRPGGASTGADAGGGDSQTDPTATSSQGGGTAAARVPPGTRPIPDMTMREHYLWVTTGEISQSYIDRELAPGGDPTTNQGEATPAQPAAAAAEGGHTGGDGWGTGTYSPRRRSSRTGSASRKHEGGGADRTRNKRVKYRIKLFLRRHNLMHTRWGGPAPIPADPPHPEAASSGDPQPPAARATKASSSGETNFADLLNRHNMPRGTYPPTESTQPATTDAEPTQPTKAQTYYPYWDPRKSARQRGATAAEARRARQQGGEPGHGARPGSSNDPPPPEQSQHAH